MKDLKNDSADTLARFGRDKRARIVKVETERVERTPRPARSTRHDDESGRPRRRSFNPNFDADNRPLRSSEPRKENDRKRFFDREDGRSDNLERRFEKDDSKFGRKDNKNV